MILVKNKADCCGCTACYSVCPQKAISMQQDQEGFLYPFVEISKCIDCKLCDSACPIENKIESKMFDRKAYVLRAKDERIVSTSTSGGFVTPLGVILSILVDTFSSRISLTMPPSPKPHNTACVLS